MWILDTRGISKWFPSTEGTRLPPSWNHTIKSCHSHSMTSTQGPNPGNRYVGHLWQTGNQRLAYKLVGIPLDYKCLKEEIAFNGQHYPPPQKRYYFAIKALYTHSYFIMDHLVVLPFPHDFWRRWSSSSASQVDSGSLFDHLVRGSLWVDYGGGHDHVEVTPVASHGVSVDLTHVVTLVRLLNVRQVQLKKVLSLKFSISSQIVPASLFEVKYPPSQGQL